MQALGIEQKMQRKKTPGHADMDQCDNTNELSPELARNFRTFSSTLSVSLRVMRRCVSH